MYAGVPSSEPASVSVPKPPAEPADVVDGHDARVLQLTADLRLLQEPLSDFGPVRVLLQQHLHRQVAAQVAVAAAQHRAHAAAGNLAEELIAVARLLRRRHG